MTNLKNFFENLTSLSAESREHLSSLFESKILKKGEYFIRDGEIAKDLAILENGIVRVFHRNDKGIEYNKNFLIGPCLIGGYTSLITNKPAQINQQALTDCIIHVAKYAEIQALYSTYPDIERTVRILAEQFFVEKEQREIDIVLLDAEKRYTLFKKQFPQLEQKIPQYHIASYLGITPTQLSRIRKKIS